MKNQTEVKNLEPVLVTPAQIAERWSWHPESVRRKLRAGSIPSLVIGRRRLVRLTDVEKIEKDAEVKNSNN
jgi:hypothetical protein